MVSKLKNFILKHWFWLAFGLLIICGAAMRLYQLGQVPHGMTWDEAAIGYNGYAILTTRRDEWLVRFPISFRSFGDYKAPLGIYLNGIFTHFLGMNLFAVRLPFALASWAGIPGFILLTQQLLRLLGWQNQKKVKSLALFSGFLLTFSPWHIHFSRLAFETGMMTSFVIWGLFCLCSLLNQQTNISTFKRNNKLSGLLSPLLFTLGTALFLAAAVYTYHSAKIVVPLLVLIFGLFFRRQFWQKKWWIGVTAVISFLSLWPFIKDTLWSTGGERFTQATVFGLPISVQEKILLTFQHFFRHFQLDYLIQGATTTLRHGDGQWGVLLPTTLILTLTGIVVAILAWWKKLPLEKVQVKLFAFSLLWIIVGTLPAAIGRDVPHSNRDFLALPGFLLLATFSWSEVKNFLERTKLNQQVSGSKGERNLLVKSVVGTWILLDLFLVSQYLNHYFTVYARQSAPAFQDGYLAAAQFAQAQESQSDKILFTDSYGQPYIYTLFVRQTNPIWYQGGSLVKYEFASNIKDSDLDRKNTAIVATPQQIDPKFADQLIYGSNGEVRFVLVKAKK